MGDLKSRKTPLPTKDIHPEMDDSPLLSLKQHRLYQQLIGMGTWIQVIGRPDICYAISSMSRFSSAPRQSHLDLLLHIFGCLKKFDNRRIAIDSKDIDLSSLPDNTCIRPDFLHEYPDAVEDFDPHFPPARGRELQITFLCDADHAHDQRTRRSITGLFGYVGSTPCFWGIKRQGAVASSTYAAEFMALRHATEEIIHMRYILRSLIVPITRPSNLFGDNLGVIQNASNPDSDIKKKHVAISYHAVRESIAANILVPHWIKGKYNVSDTLTKQIGGSDFHFLLEQVFWQPYFRK